MLKGEFDIIKNNEDYKVGLYLRLSKEDGDKVESESITNQRSILKRFCKENNFYCYKEYVDDGYSGIDFDRPGFKEMIKDIENKKINMVLTKDLARLGRDYTGIGMYIEKYFPEHNVRFKTVIDEVDTIFETDDMLPIKAVMNDLYCKEASRKFRTMLYNKKKDGMYISTEAPYGYQKDPNKKGHLIICDVESIVVKRIFNMFINGKGTYQISRILNEEKVPVPATKRKINTSITNMWRAETVRRILENETYIGNTLMGKSKKINYKSKKVIRLPRSEWIITENTHEPIISKKDFEIAQRIKNNNKQSKIVKYDYLLRGIAKCKYCGNNITWVTKKDDYKGKVTIRKYGVCNKAYKKVTTNKCIGTYINMEKAEESVLNGVRKVIQIYLNSVDFKKIIDYEKNIKNNKLSEIHKKIDSLKDQLESINSKLDTLYMDKLNGIISEFDFSRISNKIIKERKTLNSLVHEKEKELEDVEKIEDVKVKDLKISKILKEFCKLENITKQYLLKLVDKVYIDKDKKIEIVFRFKELNLISDKL